METSLITNDTPVYLLTVGQFKELLGACNSDKEPILVQPSKEYVRGLKAIADVLKISVRQVSRLKDTVLAPAIMQRCRTIKGDKQLLLELHNEYLKQGGICGE